MGLAERVINRDARAASRLLSWIEDCDPRSREELKSIYRNAGASYVIGITGPPGSGKSSLVNNLISHYRSKKLRIGVLAIDPTSPFSGGAVLGDRIRMQKHATDKDVFIRSMASRNWPGGLSRATAEAVFLLDAYGCDLIIVETVGVGQSEVEIAKLAYTTILVCTPTAGDKIQAIKAGVTEIADIVVLNKTDLPQAEQSARSIEMILNMAPRSVWKVPLIQTVATHGKGVEALLEAIEKHRRHIEENGILEKNKRENIKKHLLKIIREMAYEKINKRLPDDKELELYAGELLKGSADPYTIAEEVADRLKVKG